MDKVYVTPETVKLAEEILNKGIDGTYPPFEECFERTGPVTAKHDLHQQYKDKTGHSIPKVFIYIIMDKKFGVPTDKDEKGNLGYRLRLCI